jgi:CRP-like cAMP-binding protein
MQRTDPGPERLAHSSLEPCKSISHYCGVSKLDWLPDPLRRLSKLRTLDTGEVLFRQGDRANAIFEVDGGRMRLVRQTVDNHPVTLHTARPGELFAEAALFADRYHCDAVAAVASRVRIIPKRALTNAFRNDPALAERFMAVLARQIHGLRSRLEGRNIRSARERVLNHLALSADPVSRSVTLDGTLLDLASEIGLSHEALYRALASLAKEGVIARTRSTIILQKRRRL